MKLSFLAIAVFALLGVAAINFSSHGQPQNQAPTPVRSRADETLQLGNSIGNQLVAMAQGFPEDKYDFKVRNDAGLSRKICSTSPPLTTT
jgi:hypothetical protein